MHRWLLNSQKRPRAKRQELSASSILANQLIARFIRKVDPVSFFLHCFKWNQPIDTEVGKAFDGICIEWTFWGNADFEFA